MSSSKYIQKVFAADESSVGEDSIANSNRSEIEIFVASEALTAGATVSLDLAKTSNGERLLYVKEADATDCCPVGVYLGYPLDGGSPASKVDAAQGAKVEILTKGIAEEALTNGSGVAIVLGDALAISIDGKLVNANASDKAQCAIALEASSVDGTSRVFVINNF